MNRKKEVAKLLFDLFVNRDDAWASQKLGKNGKKAFYKVVKPITEKLIEEHLECEQNIGVYQLMPKTNQVIWGCLDFDEDTKEDFEKARKIYEYLKAKGYHPALEKSGGGDYKCHIWIFSKPIEAKYMMNFLQRMCKEAEAHPHEIFPKQIEIKEEDFGNLVKLPLGKNLSTNKLSFFLDGEYEEMYDEQDIIDKLKLHFENLDNIPKIETKDVEKPVFVESNTLANEYDKFFEYTLNNDLPEGSSKASESGDKLVGVNDNILKNQAIWFYQKGYTLEKLEEEIKPIYEEHGWDFNWLKGWFKKAIDPEQKNFKQISKGELINWSKKYLPELLRLIPKDKKYLEEKDLVYETRHLPHFELLDDSIFLMGEEYTSMKKQAYDLLISLACPENLRKIKVGKVETDLRIHPLIILPSGKGKLEFKEGIKRIYNYLKPEANIKEPRTIHYQNLIGKVIHRKVKKEGQKKAEDEYIKKNGFLSADLLIIEESYETLVSNEKNDVDCRDALIVGLDIWKKNLVQKQNIDNLDTDEETISYFPHGNCLAFCQPLSFPDKFVTKGTLRRFSLGYRKFPEKTKLDNFALRMMDFSQDTNKAIEFASYLRKINNLTGEWEFDRDAIDTFLLCHRALLEQGYCFGKKQAAYTKIMEYPLQNLLLKMSAIRALGKIKRKIEKQDVEEAFMDIIERFVWELKFIDEKVTGSLDYGESWSGATGKKQECLEWLYLKGAINKGASRTYISTFQKVIADKFDISPRRARDRYSKWKEEGLIDDYQGLKESCVWLTFTPKESMVDIEDKMDTYSMYKKIQSGVVNNISHTSISYGTTISPVEIEVNNDKKNNSLGVQLDQDVHHEKKPEIHPDMWCGMCKEPSEELELRNGVLLCPKCLQAYEDCYGSEDPFQ